ncbi:MAG: TRAP transporter substrate-binding protein [Candidimonas sp.]|nr:MAG: TRAP transporter substrate-binding protein [Candidimonas sp.]
MIRISRLFMILLASIATSLASVGTAGAAEKTYTLTIGTWGSPLHPHEELFVKPFMNLVEKNSHGRIKFKYFSRGTMVKEDTVPSAILGDNVDIALTIIDSWAGRLKDVSIAATPLWTLSMQQDTRELVPGHALYDDISNEFTARGVKVLCLFDIGPTIIASKKPIREPKDIKGMVIRSLSKGSSETLEALGASPIVLDVGDVYQALQSGTIDAAMNGIQGAVGLKYSEIAKYVLVPNGVFGTLISGYVMNQRKLSSLPPDLQKVVTDAAMTIRNEAQPKINETYFDYYLKQLEKGGMKAYILQRNTPEWNTWSHVLDNFRTRKAASYSPKIIKDIEQAAGK